MGFCIDPQDRERNYGGEQRGAKEGLKEGRRQCVFVAGARRGESWGRVVCMARGQKTK